ncbi:MAG TPA: hypothetical protein VEY91_06765 [Candidatus Limnocylindria bacterium]|nr:hypothetical protein [Candidatus Limnocylindria bacterium]
MDPRLRVELALLALLLGGFLFWQVRIPLDGLRRHYGAPAVAAALSAAWVGLAALGAGLVAARHAHALRRAPSGPSWLALPLDPGALGRHLAWNSRSQTLWLLVPGVGLLAAAAGLLPLWWIVLLAAAFAWLLLESGRLGCVVGFRIAARGADARPSLHPLFRVLATAAPPTRRPRLPAASWRRLPVWAAIGIKDLRVTGRLSRLRHSALLAVALAALSLAVWWLPGDHAGRASIEVRHFAAFVLAMLSGATLAEWLVALAGSDPFAILRALPIGVAPVWWGRVVWAVVGAVVLVAGHALAARELSPEALRLFLAWIGGAVLGIAVLGVNYGVTLFPRADIAQRLLGLSLALAVITSVMFPLAGWIVLLSALLHSARRLTRWDRLEEE